ncbi:DNA primase [Thiohalorhabdus methylotrophus]|uniref:DNA primase n=1 Tax=Thiohalorhabdus methylotrophus TaxID=3242694 RepID=A0ABV4TSW6_9GAMM
MGRIPQSFIDELLARADIVEVVDECVPLKKQGGNFKARCPFHEERTPSFNVNPERQIFHCFGCGAGGNVLGFLMEYEHLRFPEAVRELAGRYGLEVPEEAGGGREDRDTEGPSPAFLAEVNEKAARYYEYQLRHHEQAEQVQSYLQERGISGETAARFRLGFAPAGWRNLAGALGRDAANREALEALGLVINRSGSVYDRFRERLMFPIRDRRGRVIAFGGRVLGDGEPKYLNSPEGPLFHKGRELYGLHEARQALRREQRALVVEGYMDVIALAQAGVDHAVAPLGTALTGDQLRLLLRTVPEVVFCFDGDDAGRDAAWRALETALPEAGQGRLVRFLFLPEGEDPDSLVRREGAAAFRERLDAGLPLFEFMIQGLKERVDLDYAEGRDRLLELAGPFYGHIRDEKVRDLLVQRLDGIVKLGQKQVIRHLQRSMPRNRGSNVAEGADQVQRSLEFLRRQPVTRRALLLLLYDPHQLAEDVLAVADDLSRHRSTGIHLLLSASEIVHAHPEISVGALIEHMRQIPYGEALAQLAGQDPGVPPEGRRMELKGCLHKLQVHAIQARLDALEEQARASSLSTEEWKEFTDLKRQKQDLERIAAPQPGPATQ